MSSPTSQRVTVLLDAARSGDPRSTDELLPIVYDELRRLAEARLRHGRAQTLQPTALVHEAYLSLVAPGSGGRRRWSNERHFFAAAAIAMRDILVDRARRRGSLKRGGDRVRVGVDDGACLEAEPEADETNLVVLDGALSRLASRDPRKAEIVMFRYFAGLSVEQTALALDLSPATVKREWALAKALLYDDIKHGMASGTDSGNEECTP
jgi:RNA polymerase sigma factor (TIGR02999 family)